MIENRYITLKSRPAGKVAASDFAIVTSPVPSPDAGQLLLENLYLSIDPGVRNLLGAGSGYLPPVAIGAAMTGTILGRVVESRHAGFAVGDIVVGRGAFGDYSLVTPDRLCWKVPSRCMPRLPSALGTIGVPGLTAYFGLLAIGRPAEGQTVLVSGAAGGVGSIVGQIARIKGCRAVGIAGGEEKCRRLVGEFGFDGAIDYKQGNQAGLSDAIGAACPDGVDVFFDNVGGFVLDAALARMKPGARAVLCGQISQYDGSPPPQMSNLFSIVARELRIEGFLLFRFADQYEQGFEDLGRWLDEGRIRFREEIAVGLDQAIPTFLRLFAGTNQGKTMVELRKNP